jgi:hypothetical protein
MFGGKENEVTNMGENYLLRNLIVFIDDVL